MTEEPSEKNARLGRTGPRAGIRGPVFLGIIAISIAIIAAVWFCFLPSANTIETPVSETGVDASAASSPAGAVAEKTVATPPNENHPSPVQPSKVQAQVPRA